MVDSSPITSISSTSYDALLLLSFGGPEGPDDVWPFLENVTRGKNVPDERLRAVAQHYELFDGVSPINIQNRALLAALVQELNAHDIKLPVYWANRFWHPMLPDTLREMAEDGVRHALAFVTSAFGSPAGCRDYVEAIQRARQEVGPTAPQVDKLRLFFNHPGFVAAAAERLKAALDQVPEDRRETTRLLFSAHSLPLAVAVRSPYEQQLRETCRLVADCVAADGWLPDAADAGERWQLVFQSRSGPPSQPWLEPDVRQRIRELHASATVTDVVLMPIGFLSENMEVVYDLDVEVATLCEELGLNLLRAAVVGNHPRLVSMIRELIEERLDPTRPRLSLGSLGPSPDECPADCELEARG